MSEPNNIDRLSFTVFIAIILHAVVIFGITFSLSKANKSAPALNITLAMHQADKAPDKADFLAQHNQEASGSEDSVKELSTTDIAERSDTTINDITPEIDPIFAQTNSNQNQDHIDTTGDANRNLSSNEATEDKPSDENNPNQQDTPINTPNQNTASLQAKLDTQQNTLAKKPRITRHTSVSAKSSEEAKYYNYWQDRIIQTGNQNFPEEAIRKGIYGKVTMEVSITTTGQVKSIDIVRSSGHKLLDDAAINIVKLSEPFDPLPPEIQKNTDLFVIYRVWNFEIDGLNTSK